MYVHHQGMPMTSVIWIYEGVTETENCAMAMAGLSLSDNQNVGMVYCT